jgi:drug/metabolite transporter (DMT)-like permease
VLACTPAVTLLLAGLTRSEVFSIPKAFGVAFAFVGALVAFGRSGFNLNGQVWLGNLLMVLATVLGAVYAVFSKPYLAKYPRLTVTAIAMGAGAVALVSAWAVEDLTMGLPHFTPGGWLAIGYVGAAGGALSFFLYAWALGRATPTATMVLIPLNPIAAFVAGALCLGEPVGKELFAGLILVIVGIALVVRRPNGRTPALSAWRYGRHEVPAPEQCQHAAARALAAAMGCFVCSLQQHSCRVGYPRFERERAWHNAFDFTLRHGRNAW